VTDFVFLAGSFNSFPGIYNQVNILYIGSSGALSLLPFKALLAAGYKVVAVGADNPVVFQHRIIALENESLALAASQHKIPVFDLSFPLAEIIQQCRDFSVDLIVMACYHKRLPDSLINLPRCGCLNLHPSLLPAFRGPEPVFWQMKAASPMGVSWHKVISAFDAGDIVCQRAVTLHDGMDYPSINRLLAQAGTELLMSLLAKLEEKLPDARPQSAKKASYFPYPVRQDFVIDPQWTARHAYNFMCVTRIFDMPYACIIDGRSYQLDRALAFESQARIDSVKQDNGRIYIPCKEGVLIAACTGKIPQH